jgi:hypothetical protein
VPDSVYVKMLGTAEAISTFKGTLIALQTAMVAGLAKEAELVMTDAKENYVPVGQPPEDKHPGTLRASGFVDPPVVEGDHIEVTLGFGGAAEPYAMVQHERLEFHHTVGTAKYLETPMLAAAAGLDLRLAARIKGASGA